MATLGANDGWSYWGRRLQAKDYTTAPAGTFWSGSPAEAADIAAQIVSDAAAVPGSAFSGLVINVIDAAPNSNLITVSYPVSSRQTIDSMVTTLANDGYLTGFDFSIDASWSAGQGSFPVFALNISYPRRGRIAGSTGLVLDVGADVDYEWDEDASKQAGSVHGIASGAATFQSDVADPAVTGAGYPLLEAQANFSAINSQTALDGAVSNLLALGEWPAATVLITLPMFGDPPIGSYLVGDDARVIIQPDELFLNGVDSYLRITGTDSAAPEAGLSTTKFTLTNPPGLAPVPPPPL
jgi:hypothetical protein